MHSIHIACYSVVDLCTVNFSISNGTNNDAAGQDVVQMLEKAFHQVPYFVQAGCWIIGSLFELQSAEGSNIAERKEKAIELRKDSSRRSSDPNVNVSPRKSAGKQQRPSKSTKKESRTHSPSKNSATKQEIMAKANSERVSTKHLSRADTEGFQDLKRQLFSSPERTRNKEIPSTTANTLSVGSAMLSSSLPQTMLSLAEVEKKLHGSATTANSSSVSSRSIVNRPRSVETVSQSQLIDPSSFAVHAASTSLPNSKSAARLTKAASLDFKSLPYSFSQPVLADGPTLQVPSHFPPVPPVMVSPGMRSAPVSSSSDQGLTMKPISSSTTTVQTGLIHPKQQQPATTTTAEGKPLPPSSYQTPSRQTNVESAGKELPVSNAQSGPQNGLLSPMVFQDNPAVHQTNKPTPMLNREEFMQAMLHMIQVSTSVNCMH